MAGPILAPTQQVHSLSTSGKQVRVALYARVSTSNGQQDPEVQLRELREYCARRGWTAAGEYVDIGISGAKSKRPELDRLMDEAHRRRFDVVCVWKFDRMARSVSHLLRVLETFQALGVDFVSITEAIDSSTPAGKMVYTVLGAVAELERSLIVERVKAGLRNARCKGKVLGRPRLIFRRDEVVRLRDTEHLSWPEIAATVGAGVGTVVRAYHALKDTP